MKRRLLSLLSIYVFCLTSVFAQCVISNVIAEAHPCDPNNLFLVDIDFDVADPGPSNMFSILGNGNDYGTFEYGQPFYTIGPIAGDCETIYEFVVVDIDNNDCSDFYVFNEPICCTANCNISDISVTTLECTSDTTYAIELDFNYSETTNNFFDVWSGNTFLGFYEFSALPVTILDFPEDGSLTDHILVCENDNGNCCEDANFDALMCGSSGDCVISGVVAEAHPCDPNNLFLVDIDFDYANPGPSNMFTIVGNGQNYGTFEYGQPFYTIGPIAGDCETIYEFVVVDIDNNDCSDFYVFNEPICCTANCNISDISVTTLECTSDTTYAIELDFNYSGTTNNFFDVWSGNTFLGFYEFSALPVTILDFPEDGSLTDHILVCENDNGNCCEDANFDALMCGSSGDCVISGVFAEAHPCDPNNLFLVDIDFDYANPGPSNMFTIVGNGQNYGTFEYGQPFYTIGPIAGDCETIYEFVVSDLDYNNCSDFTGFNEPICCGNEPDCNISDISVTTLECTSDTTYAIELDFNYSGTTNNFFDVWSGNTFLGFYEFSALPVTILNFPEDGSLTDHILVCENDNGNCCEDANFDALMCGSSGDCIISGLVAEAHPCDPNNLFLVDIDFDYANPGPSNMFTIVGNGQNYGTFEYGQPFYTIGPIAGDCETIYEFIVSDLDYNNCSDFTGFNEPICCGNEPDCNISDISVTTLECTSDTTYAIELDFNYSGTTNNFFDVWSGNTFLGFYEFSALPVTILDFPEDGSLTDHILVCENDNGNCCEDANFDALMCGSSGDCVISGLVAEAHPCDPNNLFLVDIDFDYANPGPSNMFTIVGNGQNYGTFEYGQPFYTIGPLDGDCETIYEFIVSDLDYNNCSDFTGFNEPICCGNEPDCNISDISVTTLECTSDTTYAIELDFNYSGTTNNFFDVWSGNTFLGFYEFSALPVTILDFPEDGSLTDHILVCENDNSNCCEDFTFDALECGPNTSDCTITNLTAVQHDCDANGQFLVDISFTYSNPGPGNTFTINGNGTNYGTFEYGLDFYTIGPLDADCETIYEFIVHDTDLNDCASGYIYFDAPVCCEMPQCLIYNMTVDTLECTGDNQYAITLNFEYQETSNVGFDVYSNGDFIGFYSYNQLPLTIPDFPSNGGGTDFIEVCDNDNGDCCMAMEFPAIDCTPEPCLFENLTVSASDCDGLFFSFEIDFDPGGGNGASFSVEVNNQVFSPLPYNDLPVSVGPFEGNNSTFYELLLTDLEDPNCFTTENFGTVDCGSNFQGLTNIDLVLYQNGSTFYMKNSKHPIPLNSEYAVYDLTGRMINEGILDDGILTQEIEIRATDTRMVLVKFAMDNHIVTKKLVISR